MAVAKLKKGTFNLIRGQSSLKLHPNGDMFTSFTQRVKDSVTKLVNFAAVKAVAIFLGPHHVIYAAKPWRDYHVI